MPALIVGLQKLFTFSLAWECLLQNQLAYPVWAYVMGILGDLLVVVLCSTKAALYVLLDNDYESEVKNTLCCCRTEQTHTNETTEL